MDFQRSAQLYRLGGLEQYTGAADIDAKTFLRAVFPGQSETHLAIDLTARRIASFFKFQLEPSLCRRG